LAKKILVAGVQSGCGKTSVTLALLQSLKQQGVSVAPFKAGPDFLDPLWHKAVTDLTSYNLDTHMVGSDESARLVAEQNDKDLILVEGVMGLFDGRKGVGEDGSSLHLASQLGLEVWLVVDAKGMSGSIVPLVSGFVSFANKHNVTIGGIIANRVGSSHHAGLLKSALGEYQLPPLIGWMKKGAPELPERHLGLVTPDEVVLPDLSSSFYWEESDLLNDGMDKRSAVETVRQGSEKLLKDMKIAVASDGACCFIYPANLKWLEKQGAKLSYFSPVAGDKIPQGVDAAWIPGGYPELFAEELSESSSMDSIREFVDEGGYLLAECGGMMLLGESITDHGGRSWPMAGTLPFTTTMQDRLASLGYRDEQRGARGHEFHHSTREESGAVEKAFMLDRGDGGIHFRNTRASYVHWYFPSAPEQVASWFGAV